MTKTSPDEPEPDIEQTLMSIYKKCVQEYQWSLKDIDETNIETLLDFLFFKESKDPNTRVINGKVYRRATAPPSWL